MNTIDVDLGFIAGLAPAISANEDSPETRVLVVDKRLRRLGRPVNKSAGILMFPGADNPVDRFLDYHTRDIGMSLSIEDVPINDYPFQP